MWISGLDGFNKQRYRRWETGPGWSQEERAVHKFPRLPCAVLAISGQYLLKAKFGVETAWLRQDIRRWVQPKLIHHWLGLVYNPTTTFRSLLTHPPTVSGRPTLWPKRFRKAFTASCLLNSNIKYWTYSLFLFKWSWWMVICLQCRPWRWMKSLNVTMSFQTQIQTQDLMLRGQETEATTERWAVFPMSALKDLRSLCADPL